MRAEIETTRSLVYEAGRWVDLKKAYERLQARGRLTPEARGRLKEADRLAAVLTPLAKYHATEMGNRVCYSAMQVHGGTGYMREFSVQRHFRTFATSIYEGTSQPQIVQWEGYWALADGLLNEWHQRLWSTVGRFKAPVEETPVVQRSIDHMKEGGWGDRALCSRPADMAACADFGCLARCPPGGSTSWRISCQAPPRFRGKASVLHASIRPGCGKDLVLPSQIIR
jgi:hypothetical protein